MQENFAVKEREFAVGLDTNTNVAAYVKLPDGFYIAASAGRYDPDLAIAFYGGTVKEKKIKKVLALSEYL